MKGEKCFKAVMICEQGEYGGLDMFKSYTRLQVIHPVIPFSSIRRLTYILKTFSEDLNTQLCLHALTWNEKVHYDLFQTHNK